MCRFTLYVGPPVLLRSLVLDPTHSLVRQSHASRERSDPVNGDGFGVSWYADRLSHSPAVFRSISPAWNDRNLADLSRVIESSCVLAHVRAASPGLGVSEANCHPFRSGRLAFMHNGVVGSFAAARRALLRRLSDEAFHSIQGTTDSEHAFALFLDHFRECEGDDPTEALVTAMQKTLRDVIELAKAHGDEDSYLNFAVSDGRSAVVSRFSTAAASPSLYLNRGKRYTCRDGECRMLDADDEGGAVIVSSEPLSAESSWETVPGNHLVVVAPSRQVRFEEISATPR